MALKLSTFLTFVTLATCASAQTMITNCVELQNMKNNLAGSYALANDIDCSATVGWNGGAGFEPVGSHVSSRDNDPFIGAFDGRGHTILNLFINRPDADHVGLFGYVGLYGTGITVPIHSVTLLGVSITGNDEVGALIGFNEDEASISNSSSDGDVTGSTNVGGLVGFNRKGAIINAYIAGTVTGSGYVGGVVGNNVAASITDTTANSTVIGLTWNVGGLMGTNGGSIVNAAAIGTVTGSSDYIGGLVGSCSGDIINSYATGKVRGLGNDNDNDSDHVGGLVGVKGSGSISNSYATGDVIVSSLRYVGGLVGKNSGTITNSYATGRAAGNTWVGGLVGWTSNAIRHCYAVGRVSGSSQIGGLVGYRASGGSTTQSYWDIETSGQGNSAGGTGKTTAEMYQHATYIDWDFSAVWWIEENISYPLLRELSPPPSQSFSISSSQSHSPTPSQSSSQSYSPTPSHSNSQSRSQSDSLSSSQSPTHSQSSSSSLSQRVNSDSPVPSESPKAEGSDDGNSLLTGDTGVLIIVGALVGVLGIVYAGYKHCIAQKKRQFNALNGRSMSEVLIDNAA